MAISSHCRRLLHGLLRTYLAETVAWEPPRLTAEQRLAEYRAHLILSFGDLGPTVRHRAGRASGSATAPSEAAREAASGSTSASDEAVLRATTPEALAALYLSQLASVARRLTGAGGDWSGPARVARAYRGVGAHLHLSGSKKISSPTLPGLRNVYYIVLRDSDCPDGLWTRSFSTYREAVRVPGGPLRTFHPESSSHCFSTLAEAEA